MLVLFVMSYYNCWWMRGFVFWLVETIILVVGLIWVFWGLGFLLIWWVFVL